MESANNMIDEVMNFDSELKQRALYSRYSIFPDKSSHRARKCTRNDAASNKNVLHDIHLYCSIKKETPSEAGLISREATKEEASRPR